MGKSSKGKPKGKALKVEDPGDDNVTPIEEARQEKAAKEESPQVPEANVSEPSAEDKLAALEKDYLYARAEFENYKRHAIQERAEMSKYKAKELARDLLETLDIFQQAFDGEITSENYEQFVEGMKMTQQQLKQALERHGIVEVESVGQPFDPQVHEALGNEISEDMPAGHITRIFKSPYKYKDVVLRHGQVFVAQPKPQSDNSSEKE